MEICSEGSSSFICDSWVKFKPEYYMYWGQDFIFCQHIRLQKLWRSRDDPFHGLSQMGVKDKFRFLPHTIGDICLLVGDALEHKTKKEIIH